MGKAGKGVSIQFSREDAESFAWNEDTDEWEFITVQHVDDTRWMKLLLIVVKNKESGELYGAHWERGLTEYQDDDPIPTVYDPVEPIVKVEYRLRRD